jgi:GntR family transcriptional regulator
MLDRQADIPLYQQLADLLRVAIQDGGLAPGAELPSEADLARQHAVSKDAVRRALAVLRAEGLIITRRGYRAIIRERPVMNMVSVPLEAVVSTRMPTSAERQSKDGSPLLVVQIRDTETIYDGGNTQLRWSDGVPLPGTR